MPSEIPTSFLRICDFLAEAKKKMQGIGGDGSLLLYAGSKNDVADQNFFTAVSENGDLIGKAIINALTASGGHEKLEGLLGAEYSTKLKIEEALIYCWGAANDARVAAVDWLSTTTSIENLKANIDSLESEITQLDESRGKELEALMAGLANSKESAVGYAQVNSARADDLQFIYDNYYSDEIIRKVGRASNLIGLVSFRRDQVAGADVPWANTTISKFNEFGSGEPLYSQATFAQMFQESRSINIVAHQIKSQIKEAKSASVAVSLSASNIDSQIIALKHQQDARETRLKALRAQLVVAKNRLDSSKINWDVRVSGVLNRYASSIKFLKVYGYSLIGCLNNRYSGRISTESVDKFKSLLQEGGERIGSQLDDVSEFLGEIDVLLRSELSASAKASIPVVVDIPVDESDVTINVEAVNYSWANKVRLRGISCSLLDNSPDLFEAWLAAPQYADIGYSDQKKGDSERVDQREIGIISLGVLSSRSSLLQNSIVDEVQCWNGSPFGQWTIKGKGLSGDSKARKVLVVFYVQYQRGT